MTTKPKASRFRFRPAGATPASSAGTAVPATAPGTPPIAAPRVEDGFGTAAFPGSAALGGDTGRTPPDQAPDAETAGGETAFGPTDPAGIRQEGLTARQQRMARRLAARHGLAAATDIDAVRQLRLNGIDPFTPANMLELVTSRRAKPAPSSAEVSSPQTLPQTVPAEQVPTRPVPGPAVVREGAAGGDHVKRIQRDIARRRRRKLLLLATRLAFFVGLPTFLAGWYYTNIATPMYATNAEFVIQQAGLDAASSMGGLFSGAGLATSQDSITVQSYLTSRDAMLRLDQDVGFTDHFSQDWIDPIQRLPEGASMERAYDLYTKKVKIGYDPTEGIVKMEVVAAAPEVSAEYSRRLIAYAEERVDGITLRLREDQMSGARESFETAEEKMLAAQRRVLALQERLGVLDPVSESAALMSQVTTFETALRQKRLEREQLLSNRRPNQARVAGVEGDIARLEGVIANLRRQMTDGSGGTQSLAGISAQLRLAETELQTRTALMQQALEQLERARIEANRQVRYLSLGVSPIPPDEPTYPRAFENTLLAGLVFSGIYLLMSLTASILREQVSS